VGVIAAGVDQQLGVVQAAAIALIDAQQHVHRVLAGGGGDPLQFGAAHRHRLLIELQVGAAHQHRRLHEGEVGVVGQERLREDDQFHPRGGGFRHGLEHAGDGAVEAEQHGPHLGRRHRDRRCHGWSGEGRNQRVQVSRMKAPSLRCSRMMSSTSRGFTGRIPGISAPSPWP
jgi:hypothetical protein